jgi:hypothetical protein
VLARLTTAGLAVGPGDVVYVLDAPNGRVLRLSREGRLLTPLGRAGRGPGELSMPSALAVTPRGTVLVYDSDGRLLGLQWDAEQVPSVGVYRLQPSH